MESDGPAQMQNYLKENYDGLRERFGQNRVDLEWNKAMYLRETPLVRGLELPLAMPPLEEFATELKETTIR